MARDSGDPGGADPTLGWAADIVAAYVANNKLGADELPGLIHTVHASLRELVIASEGGLEPAVPIEESIAEDHLVCLEDGRKFKSLKRHLRTKFNMSPEDYRAKWGLPEDYPMVAPGYSKQRSQLAKNMGLGRAEKD